jgi:hypothetical protein
LLIENNGASSQDKENERFSNIKTIGNDSDDKAKESFRRRHKFHVERWHPEKQ